MKNYTFKKIFLVVSIWNFIFAAFAILGFTERTNNQIMFDLIFGITCLILAFEKKEN